MSKRIQKGNAFVTRVLAQPKLWLIGEEHDLAYAAPASSRNSRRAQ